MNHSRRVLITGNCLGGVLEQIVRELRSITRGSLEVLCVRNYQENGDKAKEYADFARTADLYIRQVGQGISDPLAEYAPASARQFRYPAVRLNFLWPFATRAHPKAFWEPPFIDNGIFNPYVSDAQLASIIETETDADEAFRRFMAIDPLKLTNLDRLYEMTKQQFLANEKDCDFGFWPQIEKRFRSERLFWDAGHPTWSFFAEIIDPFMDFLRLSNDQTVKSALRSRMDDLATLRNHDAPIHPRVAEHFQLEWWRPDLRYRLDHDGFYTYEEWVRRYIGFQFDRRLYTGYRHTFRGGGDRATGERDLREAIAADPGNMQARYYLGANLLFQGRPGEAIGECDLAAGDPDVCGIARFQACRSEIFLHLKKTSEAFDAINAAIALVPASSYYHRLLGRNFRATRQFPEARSAYREALRLDPYDTNGWIELGDEYRWAGEQAEAANCFERAIELNGRDADTLGKLADVYREMGKLDEAIELARRAVRLNPGSGPLYKQVGWAALATSHLDEAADAFRQAIGLSGNDPFSWFGLASALHRSGPHDQAEAAVRHAIALDANRTDFRRLLGDILLSSSQPGGALDSYRRAHELALGDEKIKQRVSMALGLSRKANGDV